MVPRFLYMVLEIKPGKVDALSAVPSLSSSNQLFDNWGVFLCTHPSPCWVSVKEPTPGTWRDCLCDLLFLNP